LHPSVKGAGYHISSKSQLHLIIDRALPALRRSTCQPTTSTPEMATPSPPWLVGNTSRHPNDPEPTLSGFATALLVPLRAVRSPTYAAAFIGLIAFHLHCPIEAFVLAYTLAPCALPIQMHKEILSHHCSTHPLLITCLSLQTIPSQLVRVPVAPPDPRIQRYL